jgi:hypothetical protein
VKTSTEIAAESRSSTRSPGRAVTCLAKMRQIRAMELPTALYMKPANRGTPPMRSAAPSG